MVTRDDISRLRAAIELLRLHTVTNIPARNVDALQSAVHAFGYPVWVRNSGVTQPQFCAELHAADDLPLAFTQAAHCSGKRLVWVQSKPHGDVWRLGAGIAARMHFPLNGMYRLADAMSRHKEDEALEALAVQLPQEWELEVTRGVLGWSVLNTVYVGQPSPAMRALKACGKSGAVCWVQTRSGRVLSIDGIVQERDWDTVAVRPGDLLKHVLDEAARDRLGFVCRSAHDGAVALMEARDACAAIQVQTTSVLD